MEAVTKQNNIDLVKKYHGNFMVNSKGLHIMLNTFISGRLLMVLFSVIVMKKIL